MCTLLCIARGGNTLMKPNPDRRLPHNIKVVSFRNSKAIETVTVTAFPKYEFFTEESCLG